MAETSYDTRPPSGDLRVECKPWGPEPAVYEQISRELLANPALAAHLKGTRHRLLSIEAVDDDPRTKSEGPPSPPTHFRAKVYDYTNGLTVHAVGSFAEPARLEISESGEQPLPSREEFEEAARAVLAHPDLARAAEEHRLRPYPPMPPLVITERPDGRIERTVAVGLISEGSNPRRGHEIAAFNLERQEVLRFAARAPGLALAGDGTCGLPYAAQTTVNNAPGQVWVTVHQGGTEIWKFLAVRPAASSGLRGSGVELRYVDYRGKRVLYRAHVPILNVRYDADACGPYRDWQNEEGMLHADGADVAPGFRFCPTPATTILDTGVDTGNFLGVAIYVKGQEVVLVSEMEAGWYRYVSEWSLASNGTIRPRFGFTAVNTSSCVCHKHHHHAYWRFDFDIATPGNNRVLEYNDPPIIANSNWHAKKFEIKRFRDPSHKRHWRVENSSTHQGYDILPGPNDGVATNSPDWDFPRGDLWVLRYHSNELDDGVNHTGPPCEAEIDKFVNGEPVENQDVVIWYGAHFTHDVTSEPPGDFGHIVGPDLKPVKW
jgi:hypothetical protein